MTIRRKVLALVLGGLMAANPASAQNLANEIMRQMSRQGFLEVNVEQTWLGRIKISGTRDGGSREIIVNPKTGEILRDLWLNAQGNVRAADIDISAAVTEDRARGVSDNLDDARDHLEDAREDLRDAQDDAQDNAQDDRDSNSGSGGNGGSGGNSGKGGGGGSDGDRSYD